MRALLECDGDGMKDLAKDLEKRHQNKNNGNCCAYNEKEAPDSQPKCANVARCPQLKKLPENFEGHRGSGIGEKELSVFLQQEKG